MSHGNTGVTVEVTDAINCLASEQAHIKPCPLGEVLDQISGKWAIGIIHAAAKGPVRFTELERTIDGISRRMLTLNLRKLERDGLLIRTVYPTVPPKVEYELTDVARELHSAFDLLLDWAIRHGRTIAEARERYDAR